MLAAMKTGYVDETWAKEHHQYWYDEVKAGKRPDGFYSLRVLGPLGGAPQILPAGGPGAAMPSLGRRAAG